MDEPAARGLTQGKLPHLAKLVAEGAAGPLTTTIPPVSASAWVSFATGCNPGKHGAFDFVFPRPDAYDIGVVNVKVRSVPPFWKVIEEAGGQVGLASVPITYPPQPIHGWTVCGFLVPNEQAAYTQPPELKEQIKAAGLAWPLHEFEGNRSRDPRKFLQDMRDFDESRTQVVTWLMQNRPWDLVSFVIKTTDTTQHEVWHLLDPQHPRHDAAMAAHVQDDILAYFQAIDACVGQLVEAAGPETTVVVMSDHGGGPFEKFFHVNNWLASQGFLKFKRTPLSLVKRALFAAGFTPITALKIVNLLRLGKLRKNVKRGRGRGWMGQLFLSLRDVDWTRTLAFSIGNFGQIYINTQGRAAAGHRRAGRGVRGRARQDHSSRRWRCATLQSGRCRDPRGVQARRAVSRRAAGPCARHHPAHRPQPSTSRSATPILAATSSSSLPSARPGITRWRASSSCAARVFRLELASRARTSSTLRRRCWRSCPADSG